MPAQQQSETYPVFVNGNKIGEASEFSFQRDIETESYTVGPLMASVSDKYELGDRQVNVIGTECQFTVDVLVSLGEEITTVEVAVPKDGYWRVYEFRQVVAYESTVTDSKQVTEFVANDFQVRETRELGPDTGTPGPVVLDDETLDADESDFTAVIHDEENDE